MSFENEIKLGETFLELPKSKYQVQDADNIGQYPFYTSGDKVLTHSQYNQDDDIIFLATGGKANVKFNSGKAAYSTDTYAIKGKEHSGKYLYYLLLDKLSFIDRNFFSGSGLKHLQKKDFKNWMIGFPDDINEEKRIVQFLSTLDNAIIATEKLAHKYQRIKTGLLHDLLTRGIDEHGNLRNEKTHKLRESPLGKIPVEWECKQLGTIKNFITSGSRNWAKYYSIEGALFLRITNLIRENINLKLDDIKRVSIINDEGIRTKLYEGDILISITADLGIIGVIKENFEESYINQHIALFRILERDKYYPRFLAHYLSSYYAQEQFKRLNDGGAKAGLNLPTILKLNFPFFNIEEQKNISLQLDKADEIVCKHKDNLTKLQSLKTGLMQDLMSGRVRIK